MNPARLAELERQRALVRSHLDWLDREIASESSTAPSPVVPSVAPSIAPPAPAGLPPVEIEGYEPDPVSAATAARRGCLIYLCLACLLLVLGLVAIYYGRYRDRPLLFVPRDDRPAERLSPPAKPASPLPKSRNSVRLDGAGAN